MVTHQKDVYYRHGIWHLHFTLKTNTWWQLPWMVTHHPSEGHPPNPWTVTHHPKDGHPPEGSVLHSWNLAFALYSQNLHQVTIAIDGLLPSLSWSPHPRMVTQCFFSVMLFSMVLAMLLTSGLRGVDFLVIPPLHWMVVVLHRHRLSRILKTYPISRAYRVFFL